MKTTLVVVFCVLGSSWFASARVVDRIVAYINDDIITLHELEGRLEERALELQQVYRFSPEEAQERAQQEQATLIDRMLRETLLYQEAQRRQIEVTESEVDQYIDSFKKSTGIESDDQLRAELRRRELSLEGFRAQTRRNLMAQGLIWEVILPKLNITDMETDRFFAEHRSEFPTKLDDVSLRHVFVAFEPAEQDIQRTQDEATQILALVLQPDADFVQLIRKYSQNPQTRERDGRLDLLPEQLESLPENFQQAVNGLKPGEITGPIHAHDGFHIIRLEQRTEEAIQLRHIFLPIVAGEDAKLVAQDRVAAIRARLEAGDDFAQVAQELSEDEETRESGGELGLRNLSEFPTEIRLVLDNMTPGSFSTPVPTTFGVHIFKLEERSPATLTAEEREQVQTLLRQQKFEEMWLEYTDELKEQSFVKISL